MDPAIAVFGRDPDTLEVIQGGVSGDIVQVGEVPEFLLSVLMKCPDLLEGTSRGSWRDHDAATIAEEQEYVDASQTLLLMIADREACKDGFVYHVAVNHKGKVLPTRMRGRAVRSLHYAIEWYNEGVPLEEMSLDREDTVIYEHEGSGWDDW